MTNMGSWRVAGWVPGIALQPTPVIPHPGYTPPAPGVALAVADPGARDHKVAVGLRSVDQLSLYALFSVF